AKKENISIEQAGRKIRYFFYNELKLKYQAQKVAIGHHSNDQIETVLMRIIRGTGLEGLTGIPAKREHYIRPLLECSRSEIEDYCYKNKIIYFLDSSNEDQKYFRNKIRNALLPLIAKEYNSSIYSNLLQLQDIAQEELILLRTITEKYYLETLIKKYKNWIKLDIQKLKNHPVALQRRILRKSLKQIKFNLDNINYRHIEKIRRICLKNDGEKYYNLPGKLSIRKSYSELLLKYNEVIKKKDTGYSFDNWKVELPLYKTKKIPKISAIISSKIYEYDNINIKDLKKLFNNISKNEAYIDFDKLLFPLSIRARNFGDKFKPLNSNYYKKIKSYFIDEKIPLYKRGKCGILVDGQDRIVWIIGLQLDDRYKITENTKKILYLKKEDYQTETK
ncbi:MAG: tRNA lysidine(34) synthetase TilS, partial [Atribacterota bacterium]|nr:tRNA lysidine(34) synthetase TilS [Atribacterota bacterium]